MPRALFADSIATRRNRRGLGAVPLSLAVHGLVIGAAALYAARPVAIEMPPPPLTPLTTPVLVTVKPNPVPAAPTATAPRLPRPSVPAPNGLTAPSHAGPRPDLSGESHPLTNDDVASPCISNCDGAAPDGTGEGVGFLVGPISDPGSGTGEPGRLQVGGNIRPPAKVRDVAPRYPPLAQHAHIQGNVEVHCVIDTKGTVVEVDAISGPPLLVEAAVEAVRQWRYTPTLLNGVPVEVEMTVTVRFALR